MKRRVTPSCLEHEEENLPAAIPPPAKPPRYVTTIAWKEPGDRLPPYGMTVVVWMPALGITTRCYRDARLDGWRLCGTDKHRIVDGLIAAWTELPNGPLPPPDGGAA